jgi:hypothetical protein
MAGLSSSVCTKHPEMGVARYVIHSWQFEVLSCGISNFELLKSFIFYIYAFQAKNKKWAKKNLFEIQL